MRGLDGGGVLLVQAVLPNAMRCSISATQRSSAYSRAFRRQGKTMHAWQVAHVAYLA